MEYKLNELHCDRLNEYLSYEAETQDKSENTTKNYAISINTFLQWVKNKKKLHGLGDTQLKKIMREDLIEYQTKLLSRDELQKTTINAKMTAIYQFLRYLKNNNIISENPYVNIDKLDLNEMEDIPLTKEELYKLLNAVDKSHNEHTIRDKALFIMAINTGMRISEMTKLKISDIHGNIIQFVGKGKKQRSVSINDSLRKALNEWLELREDIISKENITTNYIFLNNTNSNRLLSENADKLFKEYGKIANISKEKCHFHIFRHTYATMQHKNGTSDITLQKLLGHKNLSTTQRYTHVDEEECAKANDSINIG